MRRRRSLAGAVITAIALDLREVFEPRRRDQGAYEIPAPEPPPPDPFTRVVVEVDPERHRVWAVVRARPRYDDPWW